MRKFFGILVSILALPVVVVFLIILTTFDTVLNPSFYDDEFVSSFYSPVSAIVYDASTKEFPDVDKYILESEFEEILKESFPSSEIRLFLSDIVKKLRDIELDFEKGSQGLLVDLKIVHDGLNVFSEKLSERLYDKLPDCSISEKDELCVSKVVSQASVTKNLKNDISFTLERDVPASFQILKFEPLSGSNLLFNEFSFSKLIWGFASLLSLLFLIILLLLWRPFSFTFNYLGVLTLFFASLMLVLRTMIYGLFEGISYTESVPEGVSSILMDFVKTVLHSFTDYAVYAFVLGIVLIVLGVYFRKEAKRNKIL